MESNSRPLSYSPVSSALYLINSLAPAFASDLVVFCLGVVKVFYPFLFAAASGDGVIKSGPESLSTLTILRFFLFLFFDLLGDFVALG